MRILRHIPWISSGPTAQLGSGSSNCRPHGTPNWSCGNGALYAHAQDLIQCDILWDVLAIVLDTSVVVAGLRTRLGAGNAVLRLVAERRIRLLATPPLFLEYEDVLKRPEHRLAHGLTPWEIDGFLAELAAVIEPVEVHFQWRPQTRDPNDEMVLEAAINGEAEAIVTYNVADFAKAGGRFAISILRPAELLKRVKL